MTRIHTRRTFRCALLLLPLLLGTPASGQSPAASTLPPEEYRSRRSALREKLGDSLVVLFGNTEGPGSESYTMFRQESNFYYLTGYAEPGAIALLAPEGELARNQADRLPSEFLFLPPRNPREEIWSGPRVDPADPAAAAQTGFEAVAEVASLQEKLRQYARHFPILYTLTPDPHGSDSERALQKERGEALRRIVPNSTVRDARQTLAELREVKSSAEIGLIRQAVACTREGLYAAAREVRPGQWEYQVAALLKFTFEKLGCTVTGFHPIVAAGPRSVILHYVRNSERMEGGDLVVLDVGAEFGDYSADVTRTLPVSGRFTARQREIYEIVLGAQKAVIEAIRPGMSLYGRGPNSLYRIAYDYLNSHGTDRKGQPLGKYFTHGLGHSVGLDVHDPMNSAGVLRAGMVVAIEPGLYLPEENFGVRIEDMVLVTDNGYELLTAGLPREPDEVEAWMRQQR